MSKLTTRRARALIVALSVFTSVAYPQFSNVDFLRTSPNDAVKYVQAYISPWANAFGAGLNGSWYNTAKPHILGGFDVTASLNVGIVPSSAGTFDISSLGLSSAVSGTGKASTVSGPDQDGPQMTLSESGHTLATFNAPPGANWRDIPIPT